MNCNERLLQLYIDGGAEEPAATLLCEHVRGCASCRRELTRLKSLDWDLSNRPAVAVPAELARLRREALAACFEDKEKEASFGASDLLRLQAGILQGSTAFMGCLPGSSALRESVRRRRKPAKKQSVLRSLLRRALPLQGVRQ